MEKKLYRVKVLLYVMAENESEARVAASTAKFDIFECTARKADHLDPGWEDAIPYNSNDGRTCSQMLTGQPQAIHPVSTYPTDPGRPQPRVRPSMNESAAQASPN